MLHYKVLSRSIPNWNIKPDSVFDVILVLECHEVLYDYMLVRHDNMSDAVMK